jgi:hypothetical protein
MVLSDQNHGNGRWLVLNQQELKFLRVTNGLFRLPFLPVCPAVKLRIFSSHWFINRSSRVYFCGFNWPLSFPPSLILQIPRHHHSSIHLNRIQSPWSRKHDISSKSQDQLMNIHGVITQKTTISATSTTTRWAPALPTRVCTPTNALSCPALAQSVGILAALKAGLIHKVRKCINKYIIYIS